ncbi:MAG: cation transporter [Myxococcales bacterium]|nr:cation transporter [Myxococcales bacterium]
MMRRLKTLALASVAVTMLACAAPLEAGGGKTLVLSLQDINCQSCGARVATAIRKQAGVRSASFDKKAVEVTVRYDPKKVGPNKLVAAAKQTGFRVVAGRGKGRYEKDTRFDPKLDVKWISRAGEGVDIEKHRASGKVTVFDFYAKWCGPCRKVDAEMAKILAKHNDVALRKINIVDWDKPVARRYLRKVPKLPYVIVYGRRGKRVAAIFGLKLAALRKAIAAGRSQ